MKFDACGVDALAMAGGIVDSLRGTGFNGDGDLGALCGDVSCGNVTFFVGVFLFAVIPKDGPVEVVPRESVSQLRVVALVLDAILSGTDDGVEELGVVLAVDT